jgi:carbohydrate-selective porin OprB
MHALALLMLLSAEPDAMQEALPDAGVEVALDAGAEDAGVEPAAPAEEKEPPPDWSHGTQLTGRWGGARDWLEDHGITLDFVYAAEIFANAAQAEAGSNSTFTGHLDVAITLDFEAMGLWPGGKFYAVGQNNHGVGINEIVGSTSEISNIEGKPYTQLGEFFFEQTLFKDLITLRLGKQDANREFGTPRFGGNFINNNFGLIPSTPFPSYPTNGLGATLIVKPLEWLAFRAMFIEGSPKVGSFGFDTAFAPNAGHFLIASVAATHVFGAGERSGGTSSAGFFRQQGQIPELADVPMPRTFDSNYGFFVQHDERVYLHPGDKDDPRGLTWISRVGWSQPDRTLMSFFVGSSVAWHGLGARQDDTVGIGFGYFTVQQQANGTPGPGSEFFVELFYKWRLTHFLSLQPDLQYYRTPGGDGRDALLVGVRLKVKG